MEIALIVAVVLVLVVNGIVLWYVVGGRRSATPPSDGLLLLQQEMQHLSQMLDTRLTESSRQVHSSVASQLSESAKLIREVTEGLTKLDDTNRQVVSFAEELKRLQDVLKNPKQRGVLGEYYLETVLKNVLPPGRYQMQYGFSDGEIVDAVIFLDKDKILPIDSKFSLENYNRLLETPEGVERERLEKAFRDDIKLRINETAKYIRPKDNTMEFAFMFIPSEGIYYDLLVNRVGGLRSNTRDLIEYAFQEKKVIIVSPTSFLAYLQTVLQGLRALQIEEGAKEIRKRVEELGRHLGAYNEYFGKLGTALETTVNHYNKAGKELSKIDKDVLRITDTSPELAVQALEKPHKED